MTALLEVDGLARRFGGVQALSEVTFTVDRAELFAVIGPNGAGKTTLLNQISGLDLPTEGAIRFAGQDITGNRPWKNAKRGLARTLQKPSVVPTLTVRDNVALGHTALQVPSFLDGMLGTPRSRRWWRDAEEKDAVLLERLGISGYADRSPAELPHGVLRLIEVARALATEPKLILLDEPAAGLSRDEVDGLDGVLKSVAADGVAICLVEHNMRLVMGVADRILVLNHGKPLFQGTPSEVMASGEVIEAYLGTRGTTGLDNAEV